METNVTGNNHVGQGDHVDALHLFDKAFGRLTRQITASPVSKDSSAYYMKHKYRGKCLIFNHKDFDKHTNLNVRNGTDLDAEKLYHRFRNLDFDVRMHPNLKAIQVLDIVKEAAEADHSQNDCFVLCFLSHGEEGVVYARDGKIMTEMLFAPFRADVCPTLANKPKLFFIQACQGDKLDKGAFIKHGESVVTDSVCKIPTHADFFVAYSTVPGFYSWRNTTNGSWFIQGLCIALEQYGAVCDLLEIMTVVNRIVAYGFESCVPSDSIMDKKKQVPYITYTLTRKVYFPPKI